MEAAPAVGSTAVKAASRTFRGKFLNSFGEGETKVNIKTTLKASVAAAALFAVAVPVAEAGTVSNGNGNSVTLSGQINKAFAYHDDGKASDTAIVDNDNSGSRFRILGSGKVNEAVSVGTAMEIEFQDAAMNDWKVNDSNSNANPADAEGSGADTFGQTHFNQRRMEAFISHKQFGKVSIGQGPTASDGTAESSLSGAGIAAGGGFNFNDSSQNVRTVNQANNTFGTDTWGTKFTNLDGLSRNDRIRYDTPTFAGFQVSGSALGNGAADVALRYSGKFGGIKVKAATSYVNTSGSSTTVDNTYVVSAAAEHDSGINVRGTYGKAMKKAAATDDTKSYSLGIGYDASLTSMGTTSFAVGYFKTDDLQTNDDEATQVDFGVVQSIKDAGTELYVGVALLEFEDSSAVNYEDATSIIAGTRIKF